MPRTPNKIIEASRARRGPGRKSEAYLFLEKHYNEIIAGGPLSWKELAGKLNGIGMRDVNGKPLSANSLHTTFQRVQKAQQVTGGHAHQWIKDDLVPTPEEKFDFKVIAKEKNKP